MNLNVARTSRLSTSEQRLPDTSDNKMQQHLASTRLHHCHPEARPADDRPRTDPIIWEHRRRNFALRDAGVLSKVCPIRDGADVAGIDIFDADQATVEHIVRDAAAIQAGVLCYGIHPARSYPGDRLP